MKNFLIFLLGVFVGAAGILVWGYYYNKSQESAQHQEPQEIILTEGVEGFKKQAVTITNYSKDWSDSYATVSFKNNTNHEITNIEFRMVYYDMNGKMLDYRDFNEKITIDSGMVRQIKILGYKGDDYYAYYKSKASYSNSKKYKYTFELKSYTVK